MQERLLGLVGVVLGIAGIAVPIAYPKVDPWVGYVLFGLAAMVGLRTLQLWARHRGWVPRFREWARRVEPIHIIGLGLLVALVGVVWQIVRTSSAATLSSAPIIISTPSRPVQPVSGPAALTRPDVPSVPGDIGVRMNRYIQIRGLLTEAEVARADAAESGPQVLRNMLPDPHQMKDPGNAQYFARVYVQKKWTQSLQTLKLINDRAYTNRPIDLETVPELAIPTMLAPGEDAIADGQVKYAYRGFHFLIINVAKQADGLISDLKREMEQIENVAKSDSGPADWSLIVAKNGKQ